MGVYGTLREGEYNYNALLKDKRCLDTIRVKGLRMYSLGMFPCVVATNNDKDAVVMEVYELDDNKDEETINFITNMEIGAGYVTKNVDTELGKVLYYAYENTPQYAKHIESGDWIEFQKDK